MDVVVGGHFQVTETPLHELFIFSRQFAHFDPKILGHFIVHFYRAIVLNPGDLVATIALVHLKVLAVNASRLNERKAWSLGREPGWVS